MCSIMMNHRAHASCPYPWGEKLIQYMRTQEHSIRHIPSTTRVKKGGKACKKRKRDRQTKKTEKQDTVSERKWNKKTWNKQAGKKKKGTHLRFPLSSTSVEFDFVSVFLFSSIFRSLSFFLPPYTPFAGDLLHIRSIFPSVTIFDVPVCYIVSYLTFSINIIFLASCTFSSNILYSRFYPIFHFIYLFFFSFYPHTRRHTTVHRSRRTRILISYFIIYHFLIIPGRCRASIFGYNSRIPLHIPWNFWTILFSLRLHKRHFRNHFFFFIFLLVPKKMSFIDTINTQKYITFVRWHCEHFNNTDHNKSYKNRPPPPKIPFILVIKLNK